MEERDGQNCALKPRCGTSDTETCRTHILIHTQLLGASCEDMLIESPRQPGRLGHTGFHTAHIPDSKTDQAQKNNYPKTKLMLLFLITTQ